MDADPEGNERLDLVETELVAQIEFKNGPHDGHLRRAAFAGLREDKQAREVGQEA